MNALVEFADFVRPISIIIGFATAVIGIPGAVIGGIVALRKIRKWALEQNRRDAEVAAQSKATAATVQTVKRQLDGTSEALTTTTDALSDSTEKMARVLRENSELRDRYDHLWGEFLRLNTVEGRLRLIERWAEEQETTVHQLTRVMSTTGANHAEQ